MPSWTSLAVILIVCAHLFFICQNSIIAPLLNLQQPSSLGYFPAGGAGELQCARAAHPEPLWAGHCSNSLIPLRSSLFVSLPCCFRGISCVLPIRLISIVNNRCGAPGNPPPLLVDCKGFWLFVMRFNPYPPQGAESLSKTRSDFILFHILRVLLPLS